LTFGAILLTPQRRPGLSGKKKGSGQPAMNRSKEAAMTIKALVVLLVGLTLASVRFAEGQQAGKKRFPYLGFSYLTRPLLTHPTLSHSGRVCASLVMLKEKTSRSSTDMEKGS
jgi:hypothetical protein